jgi:hypothetical protein
MNIANVITCVSCVLSVVGGAFVLLMCLHLPINQEVHDVSDTMRIIYITNICINAYLHIHVRGSAYTHIRTHAYTYTHGRVHINIYAYKDRQTDRQAGRLVRIHTYMHVHLIHEMRDTVGLNAVLTALTLLNLSVGS